jgi:hypothetical protein
MRSRPLLFGTLFVAAAVVGITLWLRGVWLAYSERAARATDARTADVRPTNARPADLDRTGAPPPLPGLGRELADLSQTPAAAAAALFKVESRLYTRLDSASAAAFGCDEGMPSDLLFAADARVLGATGDFQGATARLELTSVAHASDVDYERGCDLAAATVQPEVRVDTVEVYLQRHDGRLESSGTTDVRLGSGTAALAGPLRGIATADWDALAMQADSIRNAHGQPLARPWPAGQGHYDPHTEVGLFYPDYYEPAATCPSAATGGTPSGGTPELEFAPVDRGGMFPISGAWFAIYETKQGGCIAPVTAQSSSGFSSYVCPIDPSKRQTPWAYRVEGVPRKPALLVRNVAGLRTGPAAERYTYVSGPGWEEGAASAGWSEGVLVFSSRGEVLRIVEVPERANGSGERGYYLNVWFGGRRHPLKWVDDAPGQTWGVYWAGLLNGDDVPDLVIRTTRQTNGFSDHELSLHLSSPDDPNSLWRPSDSVRVLVCGG